MFSLLPIRWGQVSDEDFLSLGFSEVRAGRACRSSKLEAPRKIKLVGHGTLASGVQRG